MKISTIRKSIIVIFWLLVWQLGALLISNDIVLAGPYEVCLSLAGLIIKWDFWKTILISLGKIGLGFLVAFLSGVILGILSHMSDFVKDILSPLISVLKSIPVASFVVLLLLWAGGESLSFLIVLLIAFPHIYIGILKGLENTNKDILVMADSYDFSYFEKCIYIYRDALRPTLLASIETSLGLAWKSGVAAEVIALPDYSIGTKIYMSKIYLDTPMLFAWTLVVILLSFIFEKAMMFLVKRAFNVKPCPSKGRVKIEKTALFKEVKNSIKTQEGEAQDSEVIEEINDINVTYGENKVLENVSLELELGQIYTIMAPSGKGKTTLINEISRRTKHSVSMMFQEDRLLEDYDVITNVILGATNITKGECEAIIKKLLPAECIFNPCNNLSGGMKRRVALLRSVLRTSDYLILDEPFSGLDDESKNKCIDFIHEYQKGRTVIIVTHEEDDEKALNAKRLDCI